MDIVGTGGDRSHSVNISTMAALVVAGAGERVVNTATVRRPVRVAPPTFSKSSGSCLTLTPEQVADVAADAGSRSVSRRCFTRHFATPLVPAKRLVCPRRSTSSVR